MNRFTPGAELHERHPRHRPAGPGHQTIELPSWAFGNSGTRFKVFGAPGVARDPFEKVADAAQVHRYTGAAPRVSLHIPWDRVDDHAALGTFAAEQGVAIGAINSNLFQDDDYRLGSLTHAEKGIRDKAIAHHAECVDVMRATGSTDLKLWLPDGTNYAGQDDLRARQDRLADSLQQIYALLDPGQRLLVEYKIYEPYFYAMDIPDWGTSLVHCLALGEQAQVSCWTPATTRPAPTSSSSSCSCCGSGGWAPSTSTAGTTATTTSSWARPTRSSCSRS